VLGELLQPPSDREPTAEEWAVWSKAPTCSTTPGDGDEVKSLAERAGVPFGKVAALEQLVATAHHHPLLLGFAAADLKRPDSSWEGVLRRLQNLTESDLQRKVEDMIGEMCDDLAKREPEALTLLESLLVFYGGATAEALRFVWCGKRVEPGSAEAESFDKACRAARHAALLSFTAGRYDLHPLVRQYLANHSRLNPRQRNQWAQAHAVFFLEYARRRQRDHEALEREQLNLFGAMDSAEQAGVDFMVVDFARCLFSFLWVRGFWSEGRERMERGVAAAQRLKDRPSEAFLLHALGVLSVDCGEFAKARSCLEQSLEIKKTLSDETGKAVTLHELGFISRKQGDHAEAQRYLEESLALERASGHRLEQAWTLHQLGVLCKEQEKLAEAQNCLEESLALFEQLDHKVGRAATSREFGDLCRDQGKFDEARRYYEESLPLFESVRDKAGTLYKLARLAQAEEKLDEAEELHRRSLAMAEKAGSPFWRAHNLYGLGQCAKARGEREEAERLFEKALAIAERLEIPLAERVRAAMRE
jgi:tetratricopeptide (TPR) repeat protein